MTTVHPPKVGVVGVGVEGMVGMVVEGVRGVRVGDTTPEGDTFTEEMGEHREPLHARMETL